MPVSIHIITTLDPGGAEKQLVRLVRELKKFTHQAIVIYLKGSGQLSHHLRTEGIDAIKVTDVKGMTRILRKIKGEKTLIVHGHLPRAEIASLFFSLILKCPLVLSKHNTENFFLKSPQLMSRLLATIVNHRARRIICISEQVRTFQLDSGEVKASEKNKLSTIHYGIELENHPHVYEGFDSSEKRLRIMTACRLVDQKYPELVIHTIASLNRDGYAVELAIFGEGPKLSKLRELCSELGLDEDRVKFVGIVENLENQFGFYDLFVLATHYEGFGLVALEAAASGLPILVSNIPVMKEIWVEPILLFSNANIEELKRKISLFIESETYRTTIRNVSLRQARSFGIKKTANETLRVYEQVLEMT